MYIIIFLLKIKKKKKIINFINKKYNTIYYRRVMT